MKFSRTLSRRLALAALLFVPAFALAADAGTPPVAPTVAAPAPETPRYTTTREMQDDVRLTRFCLDRFHISQKKVDAADMRQLIKNFFAQLDPSRSFFLQSDYELACARFEKVLPDYLKNGSMTAAFGIYEIFEKRVAERVARARERLTRDFDLAGEGSLKLNRKDEPWCDTEAGLDAFWEKRLTNDLINELIGGDKSDADDGAEEAADAEPDLSAEAVRAACEKIAKRYEKLRKNLVLEPWEIEEMFLNSLTAQFDPHTTFFPKESMEDFQISMRNSLCGIGAVLYDDEGYCTVREIIPGGPVDRSGKFSVGDRIIAVGAGTDDSVALTDVVGMRLNRVVRMLRGKKGETVRLLVESGSDHGDRKYISLVRDEVKLTEQLATAKLISIPAVEPEGGAAESSPSAADVPVGVISLPAFYGKDRTDAQAFSTTEDVKELLGKLKDAGARAIVLDLRDNGGGYLNEAVDLTELFVGSGEPVLQVRGAAGSDANVLRTGRKTLFDAAKHIFTTTLPEWNGPLVVLVSKASASASEIVAGALRDNRRAVIVGDAQTHGKGTVQEIVPFSYLVDDEAQKASIKITRSKWYAPSGDSIQLKGVAADIRVPTVYSVFPISESDLENPLPWDSIPSVLDENRPQPGWLSAPVSPELIAALDDASRRRQAELPEFVTHDRAISWWERAEKNKAVPLDIRERIERRAADKAFVKALRDEYETFAEHDFRSEEIRLDSAVEAEKSGDEAKAKGFSLSKRRGSKLLPASGKNGDADEKEDPEYDIVLREAARIAADWVKVAQAAK
ncbi:MAG: carboxy terminal-processing peptidase [Candidatus Spyradosoma sp.]